MSGMRRGLRGLFGGGSGPRKPGTVGEQVLNWGLWIAVAAAAYLFVMRRCS